MATNRYGEQPVVRFLKTRGILYSEAADAISVDRRHFRNVCGGVVRPSPVILERLPKYIGLPVECLFTEEALATEYNPMMRRGRKPLVFSDAAIDAAAAYLQATEGK